MKLKVTNPIINIDMPDPDVIRIDNIYYMASTTMHFMPGAIILRSYNLVQWEIVTHVYSVLDDYPAAHLENNQTIYGSGMWAPSLRFYNNKFFLLFIANDTHKTYLYTSNKIEGPWEKQILNGFYYDASLFFDDNKVYIVHGNTDIYITELNYLVDQNKILSERKENGFNKLIISDKKDNGLGYEGSHLYKIGKKYYLFNIHWPKNSMRTESCFSADSLDGLWTGGDVLCDDMGYMNQGVAQGGLVDTEDGKWYAILFQDRGASGRMPVLVPVEWKNNFPVFGINGKVEKEFLIEAKDNNYINNSLFTNDFFDLNEKKLLPQWEWNHIPDNDCWERIDNSLEITTNRICNNLTKAKNILTQRIAGTKCEVSVSVDSSMLNDGDYSGLCMLQGCYGFVAVKQQNGKKYLVYVKKNYLNNIRKAEKNDNLPGKEVIIFPIQEKIVSLMMRADFTNMKDEVQFYYSLDGEYKKIGEPQKLYFMLDHFTGCRAGLFIFSTKTIGGKVRFNNFQNKLDIK